MKLKFVTSESCSECWNDIEPHPSDVFLASMGHIPEATAPCIYLGEKPVCVECLVHAAAQIALADCRMVGGVDPSTALEMMARKYDPIVERKFKTELQKKRHEFSKKYQASRRRKLLEKYEYRCVICSDYKDLQIDHIIPLARGGTNDEENLQVLCATCNKSKGTKI